MPTGHRAGCVAPTDMNHYCKDCRGRSSIPRLAIFVSLLSFAFTGAVLRLCEPTELAIGEWVDIQDVRNGGQKEISFLEHFFGIDGQAASPGQALDFSQVWVPKECAYHRFTNETLLHVINQVLSNEEWRSKQKRKDQVIFAFVGDSLIRGLICSVARVIAGNETHGPLENPICGGATSSFMQSTNIGVYPQFYDGKLALHFNFQKSLIHRKFDKADWVMEFELTEFRPYALVWGSGAWDFENLHEKYNHLKAQDNHSEYCVSQGSKEIAEQRASPFVNETMRFLGHLAEESSTKAVYKNMHVNLRYGARCSDDSVLEMLADPPGSGWELFDSFNISITSFKNQLLDGFHIDRRFSATVEQHEQERQKWLHKNGQYPGQLEMQMAHNFLHQMFWEYIKPFHQRAVSKETATRP